MNVVPVHHPSWAWFTWPFRLWNGFIQYQARAIGNLSNTYPPVVGDFEALLLLAVVCASTLLLNTQRGWKTAVLKFFQIGSIPIILCGAWIMITDTKEFFIHVTSAQVTYNFLPNFTNFDLLIASIVVFLAASFCLLVIGKR